MKKFLFFAPFGTFSAHHQLDAVLAVALRARGHDVQMVGCDGVFGTCDVLAWAGDDKAAVCKGCAAQTKRFFGKFGLPLRQLGDFLTPNDFARAWQWSTSLDVASYPTATFEGQPVGDWAISSVFSHFRITSASLHRPEVRSAHQGYLVNAALSWIALSRLMDQFPPDAMVVFNGRMVPYRVAFEVARQRNVRVLGHERGLEPGTYTLYENHSCCEPQPIFDYVKQWLNVPLTAEDCDRCATMTRRQTGAHMNYPGFYDYRTEATEVRQALNIPLSARILGVFTSSEFELANNPAFTSVTAQLEYIDHLITAFRERPNDYLVVRHHPNIAGEAKVAADHDFLRRAWAQSQAAPHNVRIIMPAEELSSYALIPQLSGAIAFFSSTGMESIARGVAAASLPESYSHHCATYTITDTTVLGFASLVEQLFAKTAGFEAADLRTCYRYLAASIRRHSSKFKSFGIKDFFSPDIRFDNIADLLPGHDPELDKACEFLLSGAPLFEAPSEPELQRSTVDESAFFASEERRLNESKAATAQALSHFAAAPAVPVAVIALGASAPEELTWWKQCRHRALVGRGQVSTTRGDWRSNVNAIERLLATVQEEYVLVAGSGIEYDPSFIRVATRQLEADKTLAGVRIGAWVAGADGVIKGEIGTPRYPCRDFFAACDVYPGQHQPEAAFSLCLFRADALRACLKLATPSMGKETIAQAFFDHLRGTAFAERLRPLAMIRLPASPSAASSFDTPVLFLIFNRPDLTQQVFEAIRQRQPRQLFVAADGGRPHVVGEKERCELTRQFVLDHVDWECEVKTLLRDENLGCKRAVSSAISWFFEHVESGIILEDDCLPDPSFFTFCSDLLRRYQDDTEVMHIGCNNFQAGRNRGEGAWYFSKYPHIWGWATWRRAWNAYDISMAKLDEFLASDRRRALWKDPREASHWTHVLKSVRDGKIDTWDYQWTFAMWNHGGKAALPQVNLVSNIGFRSDGTHTVDAAAKLAFVPIHDAGALEAPSNEARNEEADEFTFNQVLSPPKQEAAKKASSAQKGSKTENALERSRVELESLKSGLAWRLVGKHFHSVEKRFRRLFQSKTATRRD